MTDNTPRIDEPERPVVIRMALLSSHANRRKGLLLGSLIIFSPIVARGCT